MRSLINLYSSTFLYRKYLLQHEHRAIFIFVQQILIAENQFLAFSPKTDFFSTVIGHMGCCSSSAVIDDDAPSLAQAQAMLDEMHRLIHGSFLTKHHGNIDAAVDTLKTLWPRQHISDTLPNRAKLEEIFGGQLLKSHYVMRGAVASARSVLHEWLNN